MREYRGSGSIGSGDFQQKAAKWGTAGVSDRIAAKANDYLYPREISRACPE